MFSKLFKSKKGESSTKKDKEVSLVVENPSSTTPHQQPFVAKVSRSLLVKHSPVFRKMSESGAFKKSKQVKLKGVTATGLQKTIEYITTGSVFFLTHFEVIETLKVAHIYQVTAVNDVCTNFLMTVVDCDNVCDIYEFVTSHAFHHQVEYNCLQFLDRRAEEVLKSSGFMTLNRPTVESILKRGSLAVESEATVFRTVLTWGLNDCMRRGVDSENFEEVFKSVRPLLGQVRFGAMSEQEMSDPEVARIYKLLCTTEEPEVKSKRTSILRSESVSTHRSSVSSDSLSSCLNQLQPRQYVANYVYELETLDCDTHAVRNGETFCLSVELLKGRVFLTGLSLAFERFVDCKGNCCLYLALSAVDAKSGEQLASARGAFMISEEEAAMKFPSPIVLRDSETVDLILSVKRAVNICSMLVRDESQIVLGGDRKDVAMKIVPFPVGRGRGTVRSMVKGIKYFY